MIKAVDIAKNIKYDRYQRGLASMVYELFEKKLLVVTLKMKIFLINNLKNYTSQIYIIFKKR